jgi:hypothetical protein
LLNQCSFSFESQICAAPLVIIVMCILGFFPCLSKPWFDLLVMVKGFISSLYSALCRKEGKMLLEIAKNIVSISSILFPLRYEVSSCIMIWPLQ